MPSRDFCTFPRESPNVHAVFTPAKPFTDVFFCFFVFFRHIFWGFVFWGYLGLKGSHNFSEKTKKNNLKKTHSSKARQGYVEHVCKNSGSISQKTAWTWDSEGIWGFMLEPACTLSHLVPACLFVTCSHTALSYSWQPLFWQVPSFILPFQLSNISRSICFKWVHSLFYS